MGEVPDQVGAPGAARSNMNFTLDDIAAAVIAAFPKLSMVEQRVSLSTYELLAKGQPVTAEQISHASGASRESVSGMLDRWHGVQRDARGAVTGFWGLTLATTKHRFRVSGRLLHTWCAWDTLFLPALLRISANVESICPVSGTPIALTVTPTGVLSVQPREAILSFVLPNAADIERSVTETFCCYVHFLASRDAGEAWAATCQNALLLGVNEGWTIGARKNAAQFGTTLGSLPAI